MLTPKSTNRGSRRGGSDVLLATTKKSRQTRALVALNSSGTSWMSSLKTEICSLTSGHALTALFLRCRPPQWLNSGGG